MPDDVDADDDSAMVTCQTIYYKACQARCKTTKARKIQNTHTEHNLTLAANNAMLKTGLPSKHGATVSRPDTEPRTPVTNHESRHNPESTLLLNIRATKTMREPAGHRFKDLRQARLIPPSTADQAKA